MLKTNEWGNLFGECMFFMDGVDGELPMDEELKKIPEKEKEKENPRIGEPKKVAFHAPLIKEAPMCFYQTDSGEVSIAGRLLKPELTEEPAVREIPSEAKVLETSKITESKPKPGQIFAMEM